MAFGSTRREGRKKLTYVGFRIYTVTVSGDEDTVTRGKTWVPILEISNRDLEQSGPIIAGIQVPSTVRDILAEGILITYAVLKSTRCCR